MIRNAVIFVRRLRCCTRIQTKPSGAIELSSKIYQNYVTGLTHTRVHTHTNLGATATCCETYQLMQRYHQS